MLVVQDKEAVVVVAAHSESCKLFFLYASDRFGERKQHQRASPSRGTKRKPDEALEEVEGGENEGKKVELNICVQIEMKSENPAMRYKSKR